LVGVIASPIRSAAEDGVCSKQQETSYPQSCAGILLRQIVGTHQMVFKQSVGCLNQAVDERFAIGGGNDRKNPLAMSKIGIVVYRENAFPFFQDGILV